MRLHDGDHLAFGYAARRAQHARDLDGMMPDGVEDGSTVMLAGAGETALDAGEAFEAQADLVFRNAELARDREGPRRIEGIVVAGHLQGEALDVMHAALAPVGHPHGEAHLAFAVGGID